MKNWFGRADSARRLPMTPLRCIPWIRGMPYICHSHSHHSQLQRTHRNRHIRRRHLSQDLNPKFTTPTPPRGAASTPDVPELPNALIHAIRPMMKKPIGSRASTRPTKAHPRAGMACKDKGIRHSASSLTSSRTPTPRE